MNFASRGLWDDDVARFEGEEGVECACGSDSAYAAACFEAVDEFVVWDDGEGAWFVLVVGLVVAVVVGCGGFVRTPDVAAVDVGED